MDSFERKKGIWWLPEDPENTYYGALSFDPINGGLLEAMKLSNRNGLFFGRKPREKIDIIHGSVHGSLVTLRSCYVINLKHDIRSGFSEAQILVNYIYMGHHFDKVEDIVFEKLSLSYTHLDEWINRGYFSEVNSLENSLHIDPIKIQVDKCDIEFWVSRHSKKSRTEISITLKEKNHFDDYLKFIDFHLPNFLTLATERANHPFNIRGIISDRRSSRIYYPISGYEDKPRLNSYMMLFTFKDVEAHLETCLSNWISKSEELWPAYDEYFKHYYYSRYIDPKSQFLSYTRALEAYYRKMYGGCYLNDEEYKPIKEKLVETIGNLQIEKPHKDRLKGMVEFGHEFSLRKRIKTLCDDTLSDYKEIIEELLGKSNDFANKVSETRDNLTHNPKKRPENVIPDEELFEYTWRIQMLLRLCFLVQMKLPPDKIKQLIKRQ